MLLGQGSMSTQLYVSLLQERIRILEQELASRPTPAQIKEVVEYGEHQNALYRAVLARNVVLRRRLEG